MGRGVARLLATGVLLLAGITTSRATSTQRLRRLRGSGGGEAACHSEFGLGYLDRWQGARTDACGAPATQPGEHGSSVSCWSNPQLVTCLSRNLVARPQGSAAAGAAQQSAATGLSCGGAGAGAGAGADSSSTPRLPAGTSGPLRRWLGPRATAALPAARVNDRCSGPGANTTPVLLVHRDDTTNAFHALE